MTGIRSISIRKCRESECETVEDNVIHELGLRIILSDTKGEENFAFIHTIPTEFDALITGLLFTTRLINAPSDILQLDVRNQLAKVQLKDDCQLQEKLVSLRPTSRIATGVCGPEEGAIGTWRACDLPPIESSYKLLHSVIKRAIQNLNQEMPLFRRTGGTHGAGLADAQGNLLIVAEDVGRHNVVDRVIGKALQEGYPFSSSIMVCTGRLTGDLVLKVAVAGIPFLASISAAITSGIELAEMAGITLIGFVRGSRMNIYSHPDRINMS